jgi:hypothetical protein
MAINPSLIQMGIRVAKSKDFTNFYLLETLWSIAKRQSMRMPYKAMLSALTNNSLRVVLVNTLML